MRFRHRRAHEIEEGESYYVSMTDLMVGVLFIFIIMLAYFAMHFQETTQALTSAKDGQTQLLLETATNLQSKTVTVDVDYDKNVVCLPGAVLAKDGVGVQDRHCFAYTGTSDAVRAQTEAQQRAAAAQANFVAGLNADMDQKDIGASVNLSNGSTTFEADRLFAPGTASLTPEGQAIAAQMAQTLAQRLPCHAYGVPASNCGDDTKMTGVLILTTTDFNAFTAEGRAAQTLAVERSVAFHGALLAAQPVLGQLKTGEGPQAQALLRVASWANSNESAPASGGSKTLTIQFDMPSGN